MMVEEEEDQGSISSTIQQPQSEEDEAILEW